MYSACEGVGVHSTLGEWWFIRGVEGCWGCCCGCLDFGRGEEWGGGVSGGLEVVRWGICIWGGGELVTWW